MSAGQNKMQSFLFFLPSRRLLWRSKSVQGERRTKENAEFFVFLAEPLPLWRSKSVQGERKANISAYGPSGRRCSPEAGELRVAVRGMNFCSLERCLAFVSYPLRFARPPTLVGQLHPACSLAAFANLNPRPVCSHAAFACLNPRPVSSHAAFADLYISAVCSHAAFSYLQTYSVSLSLRAIRMALLP